MSNVNFFTKLAVDEMYDTIFFATGERPTKVYSDASVRLVTTVCESEIINARKIIVDNNRLKTLQLRKSIFKKSIADKYFD